MPETDILIVDDDPSVASALGDLLAAGGYHTRVARSGADALRMIRSKRPDLVIIDLAARETDGRDVLARLRASHAAGDLPIIILTSELLDETRVEHLELGADYLLNKPFPARELLAVIARRVEHVHQVTRSVLAAPRGAAKESPDDRFARLMHAWLEERYTDPGLTMAHAARELGYSRAVLGRCMIRVFKTPFKRFVTDWRLEAARGLFDHGESNIASVAGHTGFGTPGTFAAAFRRHYGCTPREYIRALRTEDTVGTPG